MSLAAVSPEIMSNIQLLANGLMAASIVTLATEAGAQAQPKPAEPPPPTRESPPAPEPPRQAPPEVPSEPPPYYETDWAEPAPPDLRMAPMRPRGARLHDGLFLRAGIGYARLLHRVSSYGESWDFRANGVSMDILVGGTPAPGLVLGGGLVMSAFESPTMSNQYPYGWWGSDVTANLVAPVGFVQYYFDPKLGWNVQGMVGYGTLDYSDAYGSLGTTAEGVLVALGGGWEGFVTDQWSLGGLFRISYSNLHDTVYGISETHSIWTPTFQFVGTYH